MGAMKHQPSSPSTRRTIWRRWTLALAVVLGGGCSSPLADGPGASSLFDILPTAQRRSADRPHGADTVPDAGAIGYRPNEK